MINYDNRFRKWKQEIKEYRRKKFPFLNGFFKELRIKEVLSEFNNDVRVKSLLNRLSESLKPNLQIYSKIELEFNLNNLNLREIYELKRLGKISYNDYLIAENRLNPKYPKITVLQPNNPLKVLNFPKRELDDFSDDISLHIENNPIKRKIKPRKKKETKTALLRQKNYEKVEYLCSKCNRFHKPLFQGKNSLTHLTHFKYFVEFKWKIPNYKLFTIDFKKKWKRTKSHKV